MFNKLKQFKDLRDQAKTMQGALAEESLTVEKNGVKIEINGNLEVKSVKVNPELSGEKLEKTLRDLFNEAVKKTQRVMAKKMQEMGGFPGLG